MTRIPLMAGNWKMNKTAAEGAAMVKDLWGRIQSLSGVEAAVCPPMTALHAVAQALQGSKIALGAQDIFWKEKGAYTGLISPLMLKDIGCKYVIVGHSERRGRFGTADASMTPELMTVFGDNDTTVNRKAQAALEHGLRPIICVGETLEERQAGNTDKVISDQLQKALQGLAADGDELVIAYEPVWAIGTGQVCDPTEADRVIAMMREVVKGCLGKETAEKMRLLYGGSVTPENAPAIMEQNAIDGVLVGGASLDAEKFASIVSAANA
ncbi:MAG: triose-phosphate isomerase [Armatimonadetes bacterium]|nr:triose-phosphate isomerase [Armatimonadota bacterium]NIM24292.1 triose-phosphate isomerase [Armatimonadota bacterium]NIM68161.1 triose-phosphate isomerase [Armatimonadota bacterium]NIM76621.1 triose-phosphate isomerase [Armatimonadota bacterium]NIN06366.1 triose-phosphate isomerase [Armatimonadota bacterium]